MKEVTYDCDVYHMITEEDIVAALLQFRNDVHLNPKAALEWYRMKDFVEVSFHSAANRSHISVMIMTSREIVLTVMVNLSGYRSRAESRMVVTRLTQDSLAEALKTMWLRYIAPNKRRKGKSK